MENPHDQWVLDKRLQPSELKSKVLTYPIEVLKFEDALLWTEVLKEEAYTMGWE